MFAVVFVK